MTIKPNIGIEIETAINKEKAHLRDLRVGGRRAGIAVRGCTGWKAEEDGSIHPRGIFGGWSKGVEFISNVYKGTAGFKRAITRFKKFMSNDGEFELNEVMHFNDSMGSHVHISLDNGHKFQRYVIPSVYHRARRYFLDRIEKSNIDSKPEIMKYYFRDYAKQTSGKQITGKKSIDRGAEFNLQSERSGKGLEWRAINMTGIKSWAEFDEFINILCDSLDYLAKQAMKYKKSINIRVRIDEEPEKSNELNDREDM